MTDDLGELISRAEQCPADQDHIIVYDALVLAHKNEWIGDGVYDRAMKFRNAGAYLEAALALVPEEWTWQVSTRAPKPHAGRAYLHNGEMLTAGMAAVPNPKYRGTETTAYTPTLALCIAALKTRQ